MPTIAHLPLAAANLVAAGLTNDDNGAGSGLKDGLDANQVTPGTIGFIITFVLAVVVILLMLDMTRRQRRLKNRYEYALRREAEENGTTTETASSQESSDRETGPEHSEAERTSPTTAKGHDPRA